MDTLQRLRAISLFSELSDADLALIEMLVKSVHYQVNSPVCRQGEIGDALYIIESGELQVSHVDARGVPRELDVL
ncbi:MAG: cyclic nucleotide-binding domain-containing protein, partial [Anaerolineales bacterium]|nr:cyclic nucleotide-binding domain-containing protein [Anaerolineales bacterium]